MARLVPSHGSRIPPFAHHSTKRLHTHHWPPLTDAGTETEKPRQKFTQPGRGDSRTELPLGEHSLGSKGQWLLQSPGEKVQALLPCSCGSGPLDTSVGWAQGEEETEVLGGPSLLSQTPASKGTVCHGPPSPHTARRQRPSLGRKGYPLGGHRRATALCPDGDLRLLVLTPKSTLEELQKQEGAMDSRK